MKLPRNKPHITRRNGMWYVYSHISADIYGAAEDYKEILIMTRWVSKIGSDAGWGVDPSSLV